jgi:hypothetical protein
MKPLFRLGKDVDRALDARKENASERARARAALLAPARRRRSPMVLFAAAAALVCAVALVVLVRPRPAPALSFEIGAASPTHGVVGTWLEPTGELPLVFSDASTVLFLGGARGRVERLGADGATLDLERGKVVVSVRHRPGTDWTVRAGPFEVFVTGTTFDVSWDPREEVFSITMRDGSVLVRGPTLGPGTTVVASQTLRVSLHQAAPTDRDNPAPKGAPSAASAPPPEAPAPSASVRPAVDDLGWRELAQRGDYSRAIAAAEREGLPGVLAGAGGADLLLLGDAARFTGRTPLARDAYLAARSRFSGSPAAAQAAFALGRFGGGEALGWFQRYLAEAPGGPLAREALGRILELQQAGGANDAAADTARRYLAAHPDGPHAELARSVLARRERDQEAGDGGSPAPKSSGP